MKKLLVIVLLANTFVCHAQFHSQSYQAKEGKLIARITLPAGLPGVLEWKGKKCN